ncbi:MAG TPA: hypothetical protein VM677_34845 [Actinokineospora sp.]|nr:hypothetical protein [Actinokineospora sp.]
MTSPVTLNSTWPLTSAMANFVAPSKAKVYEAVSPGASVPERTPPSLSGPASTAVWVAAALVAKEDMPVSATSRVHSSSRRGSVTPIDAHTAAAASRFGRSAAVTALPGNERSVKVAVDSSAA